MRLKKETIHYLAEIIVNGLSDNNSIELFEPKEALVERINKIISEDLAIEDKLNDEVKEIMNSYSDQINKGNIDYGKMFQMIKAKLIKDRKLVL